MAQNFDKLLRLNLFHGSPYGGANTPFRYCAEHKMADVPSVPKTRSVMNISYLPQSRDSGLLFNAVLQVH